MVFRDSNLFGAPVNTPSPAATGSPPQVQLVGSGDDEPQEVVIENVGFLALNGDTKVKIFAKGYESNSLPLPSASLFSIASGSGLFAAATHSDLVIGSTSSLREAFTSTSEGVASYHPQLSLSLPARISHVAFTADESHLVLGSASGGLAVYSVSDLNSDSNNTQPLFQLGTNGVGLREVKPNPATPGFVAIVTTKGDVQILNLNTRTWEQGSSGPVLKSNASTVCWSQRGKQMVCGMGDGTMWQMTPQGEGKAVLPSVPGLDNHFVSSVIWLENHLFITTHTPVPSDEQSNESVFHILTRSPKGTSFQYTRLPDPVPPFGMEARSPPYFFHVIIKPYAPSLKDMVVFSNTCSSDIGLVSRFSTPISGEPSVPADTWCTTTIGDDTRRAQLPLSGESFQDTSSIGMALDLSSKDNVKRPVGGEEIEESPGPLPVLMVLNHEGLLCAWHVVYNDAIEKVEKYTGMVIYAQQEQSQQQPQEPQQPQQPQQQQQQQQQPPRPLTPPRPASFAGILGSPSSQQTPPTSGLGFGFGGGPSLGKSDSPFASPAAVGLASPGLPTGSVFGTTSNLGSTFGKPSFGPSTFGQPSALGASTGSAFGQSPWSTSSSGPITAATTQTAGGAFSQTSALGTKPAVTAFGQPSALGAGSAGSAFGQTSVLGAKPTFGTPAALGTSVPAFGTPTALGLAKPTGSAFGQPSTLGAAGGGSAFSNGKALGGATGANVFGSYANKGGFSAVASTTASTSGAPIWGTGKTINTESTPSVFGTESTPSAFSAGSTGFKISSSFKPDSAASDDSTKPATGGSFGAFGTGLGDALGAAQSAPRGVTSQGLRDADMDADSDVEQDRASDDDDEDIFTPSVRQQDRLTAPPKPATLPSFSGSPFAVVNKAASAPFGNPTTAEPSSPFGQLGNNSISSTTQQSAFSNWKQTSTPFNKQGSLFGAPAQARDNPFNPTPPKATNNPFSPTPTAVANNPFGTPTGGNPALASPFSLPARQVVSAFGPTGGAPNEPSPPSSGFKEPSPDEALLPRTSPIDEVPDALLPPDSTTKPAKIEVPDALSPPDSTVAPKEEDRRDLSVAEDAPLPLGFTTPAKLKQPDGEVIPSLPEGGREEEDEADDEEGYAEGGSDEGNYDEEVGDMGEEEEQREEEDEEDEEEEDEEEDEDEEEEDEDADQYPLLKGVNITPPKGGLFNYNPKPNASKSASPGSSVFASPTSYQETIGDSGIREDAPFASLLGVKPGASSDKDHSKPAAKPSGGSLFDRVSDPKKGSPGAHGHTPLGRDKERKSGSGMAGKSGKAMKKNTQTIGRPSSAPAQTSGGSFFPSPTPIPAPAASSSSSVFSVANNKPSTSSLFSGSLSTKPPALTPSPTLGKLEPSAFVSVQQMQAPPSSIGGSNFVPAVNKPVRSSPLTAAQLRSPQQRPPQQQSPWQSPWQSPQQIVEQRVEEPKEESDLDLDKEFSDREDEKIRRKLVKGKVKPLENLPKFKSIGEVEVANDFNAVFDSIYLSGNMMINRLGLTVRGLQAYQMGQNQPLAGVKHEDAKDMKQPKDWKLCELQKAGKILDELLVGVMKENKGNKSLEEMYEAANKGFIKLDTKDAEIKRLLAVHNDAQTAATARARPLTPEQLLQQRKLRKEYTRVEKLLKDAEKEVTQLKAKIASRDKNKAGAIVPPTVEAVRNTIMKLTGMVERKTGDIDYLEERVRRLKLKNRSSSVTPGRTRGMTPERSMREETPQRFGTPERTLGGGIVGAGYGTPVLALTDPVDVAEAREEMKARKEMGKKLKGVLERNGPRMTGGQQGQGQTQGQWGQSFRLGR